MAKELTTHPVAIVEDRYGGCYSKGAWLAVDGADTLENGCYRVIRTLEQGPHGDDCDAQEFWNDPPHWIASGATPDQALSNLMAKLELKAVI
ncbi:MAG: hypothetical protein K2Z25_12940 [Beijerinckiaceae bacterium]|nr:hypothetical protein [Beijerinckiaceae bacterium]